MCAMIHSCTRVWHGLFIYMCDVTNSYAYVWHDPFMYTGLTWLIHIHVWHDPFVCIHVTWLIHVPVCDMTHPYACTRVWHDSSIYMYTCVTWLIHIRVHVCGMTHPYTCTWHKQFICIYATWFIHTQVCDINHSHVTHKPFVCHTKEPYNRDYILQKRPIILSVWHKPFACHT